MMSFWFPSSIPFISFIPLGFETMGSLGPAAYKSISRAGRKFYDATGEMKSSEYIKQPCECKIVMRYAACLFAALPSRTLAKRYF